jgi:hypothetical protein
MSKLKIKRMKVLVFKSMFILLIISANAQDNIDSVYHEAKLKRSVEFAQLTYGLDALILPGGSVKQNGSTMDFGAAIQPRLTFGGLHFWGHADFYVTFPIGLRFQTKNSFADKLKSYEGVETGMKIYPWAIKPKGIRPYLGISFQPYVFGYAAKGKSYLKQYGEYVRFISPIQLGFSYTGSNYLFSIAARFNWKNKFEYYYDKNEKAEVTINRFNFQVSFTKFIDTDKSMGSAKSTNQLNAMHKILKLHDKLSAWYFGIGPSAALQMSKSSYFKRYLPFFENDMTNSFLLPDLTFGRYFHEGDFNVGVTARAMWMKNKAYGTEVRLSRYTTGIEAYKFLLDYHGFVPFVGPMFSIEKLIFSENKVESSTLKPAIGIVFGWDIRITHTGNSLLRTNLRWTPNLYLKLKDEKVMFDHLEFNFIQYVRFIGRAKVYKQYRPEN